MSLENPSDSTPYDGDSSEQSSSTLPSVPASSAAMASTQTAPASPTEPSILANSASAPEVTTTVRTLNAASVAFSPSLDITLLQSSRTSSAEALSVDAAGVAEGSSGSASPAEPDVQILEALRSKDRLWVLKLGEMMETLINERKQPRIDLTPATTYQRMLVHKCSAYHRLTSETDNATKIIYVSLRTDSRVPSRRISELVPLEESAQPAFKIMRRQDPRVRQNSQPGSATGEDGDVSDVEPSETGSVGGRSNTAGSKRHLTIEEREAAYNEARSRIFMGFEEKEKDNSANSSTFSLASGSGSASGADDSASSAATESEWSAPAAREKRDGRRGGSAASSSRSIRSGYNQSGSNSSRHSRAASPSSYSALYDPTAGTYDPAFGSQGPPHGYIQYYYGYPTTAGPGPPPPFMQPYAYGYPPYGYAPPQQPPSHPHSDPVTPGEPMYPPSHSPTNMPYPPNPYFWPPPPGQSSHLPSNTASPASVPPSLPGAPQQNQTTAAPPPMQSPGSMGYPNYFPPQYGAYPAPGYYPPYPSAPPGQMPPPHMPNQYYPEPTYGAEYPGNSHDHGPDSVDHSRASSRSSSGHGSMNGNGRRAVPARRQPWSYGPGIGMSGVNSSDFVGPRLNNRRTSTGSTGHRTPGDEASSVASSASSSSQRTFTSTSSKHPLPARPDWAVGLKAQPTLSASRHHDANSRNMSPARMGGNLPHRGQQPPALQATDFPPLSSAPEKKTPVVGGAWTNSSSMRSVLKASPPASTNAPTALVHYPAANGGSTRGPSPSNGRLDEQDRAFGRPPPKGNAELFNPKGGRASNGSPEKSANKDAAPDALADQVEGLTLAADSGDAVLTASPTPETASAEA